MAAKWFPFVGDAVPLHLVLEHDRLHPAADEHASTRSTSSASQIPSFALYAATANISVPLVADARRVVQLPHRGHPGQGLRSATSRAGCRPASRAPRRVPIFVDRGDLALRPASSRSRVRLFANILAGHLLILFMGGGLVVLLGIASSLGVLGSRWPMAIAFFLFEVGLVATLQAFIFATLTAIYLGGAVAEDALRSTGAHVDLTVITELARAGGATTRRRPQGRQGHRARRRRRPRHHRPGHRRRLHLRQGHRVGDPPARDARRDHVDPVARLRPDRGDRVLRLHLRPDRVLPLGRCSTSTARPLAAGGAAATSSSRPTSG